MTIQTRKAYTAALAALSFLIPGLVTLLVLRRMGFYPFGETSLLIMDMDGQYVHFYESLRPIAAGESSVFFSWSKAFGSNFTGLFAYYLSSPLSALMLLFEDAQAGIFWLTVLKTALCGLSSFFYFRHARGRKGPEILLFTVSYALMSYNFVYSLCPMWIDGVIWLPVILLGAEGILRGRGPWLFILPLAALLVSNYYTGYMVCLFGVLYVLYRYFSVPKAERALRVPQALGRFAAAYAAALGLALWLLLPAFFDLTAGKIGYSSYIPAQMNVFPLPMYLQSFLRGTYTSIAGGGSPALYSGLLTGVLCALYFVSRRVSRREKLLTAAFFALLLGGFYFVAAEIVWHIFQYPNWFPFRYSFVFHFLALSTACSAWPSSGRRAVSRPSKAPPSLFHSPFAGHFVCLAALLLVCWDLSGNAEGLLRGLDRQFGYQPASSHAEFRGETRPLVDAVRALDGGFYRMEKTYHRSLNDALGLGYRGITHYSSLFHRDLLTLTGRLGMAQNYFWNGYIGSTPLTDTLFGVKYVLSKTPLPYTPLMEQGGVTVYENPHALPAAFVTERAPGFPTGGRDCFALQNALARHLGGTDVFIPVTGVVRDGSGYTFTAENGRPVYAYFPVSRHSNASLYVNGELAVPRYFSADDNNALYLGVFTPGEEVTVSFDVRPEDAALAGEYLYTLDTEALAGLAGLLRAGGLRDAEYTASGLRGHVRAESGGALLISIPYDKGWTVKINGRKTDIQPALGAFMAVPVPAGEFTVEMTFRPAGLALGIAVSLITAAGLAVYAGLRRRNTAPAKKIHA